MELIYLWVEEYKNIHKQGFNFSGRYRCKYDDVKNELTINENKEYVHIFQDNINVTAIVGKNGSGKSSVLELVTYFRTERFGGFVHGFGVAIFIKDKTIYCLSPNTKGMHSFPQADIKLVNLTSLSRTKNNSLIDLNLDLTLLTNSKFDFTNQSYLHEKYQSSHFDDFYNGGNFHSSDHVNEFNAKFLQIIQMDNHFFDFLNSDYIFDAFVFEFHYRDFLFEQHKDDVYYQDILALREKLKLDDFFTEFSSLNMEEIDLNLKAHAKITTTITGYCIQRVVGTVEAICRDLVEINKIISHILNSINMLIPNSKKADNKNDRYKNLIAANKSCLDALNKTLNQFIQKLSKTAKNNKQISYMPTELKESLKGILFLLSSHDILTEILNDFTTIEKDDDDFLKTSQFKINSNTIEWLTVKFEKNPIFKEFYNWGIITINFINSAKEYDLNHLSNGEKNRITTFLNATHKFIKPYTRTEPCIVMLDEIEQSMHPSWQKHFLDDLFSCFQKIENIFNIEYQKLHFILTTHSPFLISDIPSDNIIFLDRSRDGQCKVVDGLKDRKQTFGANIHTLLSDAFFMEDGLMGEYAKSKINELIDYLNGKESPIKDDEEAQKHIRIIGEPILKKQLQRMLDSKRLSKIDEIDLLKTQMSEIQQKIKKLEGGK